MEFNEDALPKAFHGFDVVNRMHALAHVDTEERQALTDLLIQVGGLVTWHIGLSSALFDGKAIDAWLENRVTFIQADYIPYACYDLLDTHQRLVKVTLFGELYYMIG